MSRITLLVAAAIVAVLYLAGTIAIGSPPKATASGAEVVAWFRNHADGARVDAWTATFATLGLATMFGIIRGLLPAPNSYVFMLGGAAFITETAIQAWIWGALALHASTLEPATARTVLDLQLFWGPLLTGTTMTMIGSVTVLGLRRGNRLIPPWLTWIGVFAFAEQAAETVTVFGTHGFIEPGGAMNLVLGAGLTLLWLAALVVWALSRLRAAEPASRGSLPGTA